jgi:hypothetical protein
MADLAFQDSREYDARIVPGTERPARRRELIEPSVVDTQHAPGGAGVIEYESELSRWSHNGNTSRANASTSARDRPRRTCLPADRQPAGLTYSPTVHGGQARIWAVSALEDSIHRRLRHTRMVSELPRRHAPTDSSDALPLVGPEAVSCGLAPVRTSHAQGHPCP